MIALNLFDLPPFPARCCSPLPVGPVSSLGRPFSAEKHHREALQKCGDLCLFAYFVGGRTSDLIALRSKKWLIYWTSGQAKWGPGCSCAAADCGPVRVQGSLRVPVAPLRAVCGPRSLSLVVYYYLGLLDVVVWPSWAVVVVFILKPLARNGGSKLQREREREKERERERGRLTKGPPKAADLSSDEGNLALGRQVAPLHANK